MNYNSGAFFTNIRKIKKNNTINLSMTTKDIDCSKDFTKFRCS